MAIKGLDLSNFTTGTPVPNSGANGGYITDALVQCWKSFGYTHAVIGLQWPRVAQHQLEVCARNGMTVGVYHWLWFDRDYISDLQQRLAVLETGYQATELWVDIEDTQTNKTPQQLIQISTEVLNEADRLIQAGKLTVDKSTGIYTGGWWWQPRMNNYAGFAQRKLWHAAYWSTEGGMPPVNFLPSEHMTFKPYGGWAYPSMWQYAGSVNLCGANMDLNELFYNPALHTLPDAGGLQKDMIGANARADWFTHWYVQPNEPTENYRMQIQDDFKTPDNAIDILIEVDMKSGSSVWDGVRVTNEKNKLIWIRSIAGTPDDRGRIALFHITEPSEFNEVRMIGYNITGK